MPNASLSQLKGSSDSQKRGQNYVASPASEAAAADFRAAMACPEPSPPAKFSGRSQKFIELRPLHY